MIFHITITCVVDMCGWLRMRVCILNLTSLRLLDLESTIHPKGDKSSKYRRNMQAPILCHRRTTSTEENIGRGIERHLSFPKKGEVRINLSEDMLSLLSLNSPTKPKYRKQIALSFRSMRKQKHVKRKLLHPDFGVNVIKLQFQEFANREFSYDPPDESDTVSEQTSTN